MLDRVLAIKVIYQTVLDAALRKLKALRVGDALSPETQLGPLANPVHKARVEAAIHELEVKGARIHVTASVPTYGFYLSPTLLTDANPHDTLEEIFGPVAAVHPFRTDEEAIELANQSPYGLGGYVFSADEERAFHIARRLHTGGVKINGVSLLELNVDAPRPAWGLSGFGEEGTFETFDVFCGKSVVGVAAR
jgi:phenylacetaldehyde dehydrogenase